MRRKNILKNQCVKKSMIIISATIAIVLVFTAVVAYKMTIRSQDKCDKDYSQYRDEKALAEVIKKEIEGYKKDDINSNVKILDMSKRHYFLERLRGVTYVEPKEIEYFSKVTGTKRKATVILPKGYDPKREYPLMVAMHGYQGSHKTWINSNLHVMLSNMQRYEKLKDIIVVLPDSNLNQKNSVFDKNLYDATLDYDKTEKDLMGSLLPYVKKNYKIKGGRENAAICGLSLGGRNALYIGFKNYESFGYIGAFSPEEVVKDREHGNKLPVLLSDFKQAKKSRDFLLLSVSGGREDDDTGDRTEFIHKRLNMDKVKHTYYLLTGGHSSEVWQGSMYNFLRMVFI